MMKTLLIICVTLYVATKFGMDIEALFDSTVNLVRGIDRQLTILSESRGR